VQTLRARHRIGMSSRPVPAVTPRARSSLRDDVVEGARYLMDRPELRLMVATISSLALFQAMVVGVLVLYATGPLGVSRGSYGLFLALGGIGLFSGSILAGRIDRLVGHASCLVMGGAGASAGYAFLALATAPPLAIVGLFLEGFSVGLGNVASLAMRQELVPLSMLGRINSAFRMFIYGAVPVGALLGGLVADLWSLRTAILVAAIAQMVTVVFVARPILTTLGAPDVDLRIVDVDLRTVDVDLREDVDLRAEVELRADVDLRDDVGRTEPVGPDMDLRDS